MIILLQAAYKVPEINSTFFYDIFKDFLFPSIITVVTIFAAIKLSKSEFNKSINHEKEKDQEHKKILKQIILRNLKIITEQGFKDVDNFGKAYIEGYDLKKGIHPNYALVTFPELLSVLKIDALQFENIFIAERDNEKDLQILYSTIGALQSIEVTYTTMQDANKNFVDIHSEYDIKILSSYNRFITEFQRILLGFINNELYNSQIDKNEVLELAKLMDTYVSERNNFYELESIVSDISKSNTYEILAQEGLTNLSYAKDEFRLYFLKIVQEHAFFQNRIEYLQRRLVSDCLKLSEFQERFKNS